MTDQLTLRNKMKAKKPSFSRQDSNKYKQFENKWRRPKGMHSKLRKGFRGHITRPSIGYSSPNKTKGLNKEGFIFVLVRSLKQADNLTNKNIAIISESLSMKNKILVLEKLKTMNIKVQNVHNADEFLNNLKTKFENLHKENKTKKDKRVIKKQEKKKEDKSKKKDEVKSDHKEANKVEPSGEKNESQK